MPWKPLPHDKHGEFTSKDTKDQPDSAFAFPEQRKAPMTDPSHHRNAIARFDQGKDVTDAERDSAWKRSVAAAKRFGVEVSERGWRELGKP